jgi:copper chaperone CopZ
MITIVTIAGMRSEHCKRAVFTALTPVAGIRWAEVSLGRATIEHDGSVTEEQLRDAISVTGYVIADVAQERRVLRVADNQVESNPI